MTPYPLALIRNNLISDIGYFSFACDPREFYTRLLYINVAYLIRYTHWRMFEDVALWFVYICNRLHVSHL